MEVPELDGGAFGSLTLTSQLGVIEKAARGEPVSLIGSSLGGYLAALYAARHPEVERLVLMAPAFGFARRYAASLGDKTIEEWRSRGFREVFHYATSQQVRLGWDLMEDAYRYEDEPDFSQPAIIFQGLRDDVVLPETARQFASGRPNVVLREVDSDHELMNAVDQMWMETREFLLLNSPA